MRIQPKNIPLTGDVTGTLGATVVQKLNGVPVSNATPTDTQMMRYDGASGQWKPWTMPAYAPASVNGTVTNVNASGGATGLTFSGGPITNTGTFTLGGVLGLAYGGTGATSAAGARTALQLGTAALRNIPDPTSGNVADVLSVVLDASGNKIYGLAAMVSLPNLSPAATTSFALAFSGGTTGFAFTPSAATNGNTVTLSVADPAAARTAIGFNTANVLAAIGTLPIANGGTGATDAATARTNLGLTSAATAALPAAGANATTTQLVRGDDTRLKETRYIRIVLAETIALNASITRTYKWQEKGADKAFADTNYTISGAPHFTGPLLSVGLAGQIVSYDATGVTISIKATIALVTGVATLHVSAIHD